METKQYHITREMKQQMRIATQEFRKAYVAEQSEIVRQFLEIHFRKRLIYIFMNGGIKDFNFIQKYINKKIKRIKKRLIK